MSRHGSQHRAVANVTARRCALNSANAGAAPRVQAWQQRMVRSGLNRQKEQIMRNRYDDIGSALLVLCIGLLAPVMMVGMVTGWV